MKLLAAGHPELRLQPELERARCTLQGYGTTDPGQLAFRARMLAFLEEHPEDAHRRTCLEGHLTASALVLDAARERALLTHHRKLDRWLQLGGHCDGDANLAACALREAQEESGIDGLVVGASPLDLDIHSIPARGPEPEHWHLDVRYLVLAPQGARETVSEESHDLGWFRPDEMHALSIDASLERLVDVAFNRARALGPL